MESMLLCCEATITNFKFSWQCCGMLCLSYKNEAQALHVNLIRKDTTSILIDCKRDKYLNDRKRKE